MSVQGLILHMLKLRFLGVILVYDSHIKVFIFFLVVYKPPCY